MLGITGETVQCLLRERNAELIKARLLEKLVVVSHAKEKRGKKKKEKERNIKKQNP